MNAAGELFFPVKETAILSEKIAAMNDEDNGPSDDDKLTRALGKKDHPGRVRGFGGEVRKGYVFQNTGKRSSGVTRRDLQMLEESLMKEHEERRQLEERFCQLEELLQSGGLVQSTPKPTTSSQITTSSPTDPYPFAHLEEHKGCHLGLWINGVVVFVAHGIVMKSSSETPIHCKPLPEYYAKVIVNSVIKGYENQRLPLPTTEMRLLIDAVTSVVPWPISLLFIKEVTQEETQEEPLTKKQKVITKATQEEPLTKKQKVIAKVTQEEPLTKKQKVIAKVPQSLPPKLSKQKVIMKKCLIETQKVVDRKRKLLVLEAFYTKLSKHMKMLHDKIMQMPSDITNISLKLPRRIFHYEEDMGVSIGFEDITEVMGWQQVNVSIIQAYEVICSNSICKSARLAKVITFLCPQLTSFDQAKLEPNAFVSYLHRGLLAAKAKRSNFVFIPHHIVIHWVMLIISMNTSTLFVLDPMGRDATNIEILNQIIDSYKKVTLGEHDNPSSIDLNIRHFECPRQMDYVRCGYFVMRYMYDFCTNIHLNFTKSDDAVYEYFHNVGCTYMPKDLDFVREELA